MERARVSGLAELDSVKAEWKPCSKSPYFVGPCVEMRAILRLLWTPLFAAIVLLENSADLNPMQYKAVLQRSPGKQHFVHYVNPAFLGENNLSILFAILTCNNTSTAQGFSCQAQRQLTNKWGDCQCSYTNVHIFVLLLHIFCDLGDASWASIR